MVYGFGTAGSIDIFRLDNILIVDTCTHYQLSIARGAPVPELNRYLVRSDDERTVVIEASDGHPISAERAFLGREPERTSRSRVRGCG